MTTILPSLTHPAIGCFFCGVDSRAAAWFLGLFVVSLLLASIAFFLWAASKGDFNRIEATAWDPLLDPEPLPECHPQTPSSSSRLSHENRP
jgi:nitrogen fixation-related uncharacterized protein